MPETPPTDAREAAPSKPDPGRPPLGRFQLQELIGRGGMGDVWKAWDPSLSRWVAIKILRGGDPEETARFTREAKMAAGLDHPNIARIYEVGEADAKRFIVMQFVDGDTFSPADPIATAKRLAVVARAVAFAHERGIIHRDLKPDNLMIDREGRLFVMDFGLARPIDDKALTRSGTIVGTPEYMSPEQTSGERLTAATDVWSLGATLYKLLAGRPPFRGKDVYDLIRQVQRSDPPPPPGPRDLALVAMKCLEKDPSRRYPTALDLADDLDRFARGEPVKAAPPLLWRRLRRRPLLATATAGIVLLFTASLAVAVTSWRARTERAAALARLADAARTCLDAALDLRRAGNLDGMEQHAKTLEAVCLETIAKLPDDPTPHYHLGRMARALQRHDEALLHQEAALARDPSNVRARYERVLLLARRLLGEVKRLREQALRSEGERLARDGGAMREPPRAETLIASRPDTVELRRRLDEEIARLNGLSPAEQAGAAGLAAWASGRLDDARRAFADAGDLEEAVEALASLEFESARYAESDSVWSRGIEQDRGYLPFREGRGLCRSWWVQTLRAEQADASRQLAGAIEDFDALVRLAPGVARHWVLRGGAHMTLGSAEGDSKRDAAPHWRRAIDDFRRALDLQPDDGEAWKRLGAVTMNVGLDRQLKGADPDADYDEAWSAFERALRLLPSDARLRMWRGDLRTNRAALKRPDAPDDYAAAVEEFSLSLRLDPAGPEAWHKRASAHAAWAQYDMLQGRDPSPQYEAAERDFAESLERHPTRRVTLQRAAQTFGSWGTWLSTQRREADAVFAKSIALYDRLVALSPGNPELLEGRASVHLNRAAHAVHQGRDAAPHYRAALADADKAVTRAPALAAARLTRAIVQLELGLAAARAGADPARELEAAIADLVKLPADHAEGAVTLGRAHQVAAAWLEGQRKDAIPRWRAAAAAYERARKLGRRDVEDELDLCLRKAQQ